MHLQAPSGVKQRLARSTAGPLLSLAGTVLLCLTVWACAAATATRRAQDAEFQKDYDLAVVEYTKALREKPDDAEIRSGLGRAKLRASEVHFQRGRRAAETGKLQEALVEYELAAELNPTNGLVDDALRTTPSPRKARQRSRRSSIGRATSPRRGWTCRPT